VLHFGSTAGFLFLSGVALTAFGTLYFRLRETRDQHFLKPT
jgi:hypothetical protein